ACVAVAHAADSGRQSRWPLPKGDLVANRPSAVLLRDDMTMWIDNRVAQYGCHAVLESLRNEMFQTLRLIVHLVPGIFKNVVQKKFQQPVMPHNLPAAPLAGAGKPYTVMFLIKY